MAVKNGYNPQPGQKTPQKYPFTGANYQQYGEQPGYVYYPWKDEYYVDPKAAKEYGQANGTIAPDPEKPSLGNTVLPIAAAAGALAVGQGLGKDPTGFVKGIGEGLGLVGGKDGGLLGIGAEGAGTTAATTASQGANAALAGAGPGGLMSVGAEPTLFAPEFGLGATGELTGAPAAAAAGAEGGGLFSLGGIGAGGNAILPAVGALGAVDLIANKRGGARGVIQGAGSGAMIGSYFNPLTGGLPTGTLIGAGVGGLIGLGVGLLGDGDKWKTEQKRLNKLRSQGYDIPQGMPADNLRKGRSKEELIKEAEATGDESTINFARTRDENYLTAPQLAGYSSVIERAGKGTGPDAWNQTAQEAVDAHKALGGGVLREHHGTVDIDWKKVDQWKASKGAAQVPTGQTTRPATLPAGSVPKPNGLLSVGAR